MTEQPWKIAAYITLAVAVAFLIWAFVSTNAPTLYAVAAIWFALAAIFGRKAAKSQKEVS